MSLGGTTAFVGDSLTEGGRWQEWFAEDQAHNFGVGGDTTDDMIARLPEIFEVKPDTVVILIGTNDLAWRRSVEHIVRNIETILVTVRRELPDAHILVQSVMPRGREFASQIRDITRHLWQCAPTVRAQYLDLWPALALADGELNPEYSDDRLHLNDSGYDAWLAELRPALEALHRQPPSSRAITLPDLSGFSDRHARG
jgi:lysophospholipase L1-like esterase